MLLGAKIEQGDHSITLSQAHYINKLLDKFGMQDANPVSTPMDPNIKLDDEELLNDELIGEGEQDLRGSFGYVTIIGSLMFPSLVGHPEIVYAIN